MNNREHRVAGDRGRRTGPESASRESNGGTRTIQILQKFVGDGEALPGTSLRTWHALGRMRRSITAVGDDWWATHSLAACANSGSTQRVV